MVDARGAQGEIDRLSDIAEIQNSNGEFEVEDV